MKGKLIFAALVLMPLLALGQTTRISKNLVLEKSLAVEKYDYDTAGNITALPGDSSSFIDINNQAGAFNLSGITGGTNGKTIKVLNSTIYTMSILDEDVTVESTDRIDTFDESTATVAAGEFAEFLYDTTMQRWRVAWVSTSGSAATTEAIKFTADTLAVRNAAETVIGKFYADGSDRLIINATDATGHQIRIQDDVIIEDGEYFKLPATNRAGVGIANGVLMYDTNLNDPVVGDGIVYQEIVTAAVPGGGVSDFPSLEFETDAFGVGRHGIKMSNGTETVYLVGVDSTSLSGAAAGQYARFGTGGILQFSQVDLSPGAGETTQKVEETNGGTGITTYTAGDLIQGTGPNSLGKLAAVATGNVLLSGGVATASSWGKITASHVTANTLTASEIDETGNYSWTGTQGFTSVAFNDVTNPGLALNSLTGAEEAALSAPADGSLWYEETLDEARLRANGSTVSLLTDASAIGVNVASTYIPYFVTSNDSMDAAVFWQNTNKTLGVDIASGLVSTASLHGSKDGANDVVLDAYGATASLIGRSTAGDRTTPANTTTGTQLLTLDARGYFGGFTGARAEVSLQSTENWGVAAQGTKIRFNLTPIGSTTMGAIAEVYEDGIRILDTYDLAIRSGTFDGTFIPTTLTANRVYTAPDRTGTIIVSPDTPAIGEVMYFDGTDWVFLTNGTTGQVLEANTGAAPSWGTDDTGGGGMTIQEGAVVVSSAPNYMTFNATEFAVSDAVTPDSVQVTLDITPSSGSATLVSEEDALQVKYETLAFGEGSNGLNFAYGATLAANPALSSGNWVIGANGLVAEGTTADAIEGLLRWPTITTADKTLTLPDVTGTIAVLSAPIGNVAWYDGTQTSRTWTFDLSGTDPVFTFNSGAVALTGEFSATNFGGSNGQIPIGDGTAGPTLATITGTTDHIAVTNGAGSITLDIPDHYKEIFIPAGGMINKAGDLTAATALAQDDDITNDVSVDYLEFSASVENYATIIIPMPNDWDASTAPKFKVTSYSETANASNTAEFTIEAHYIRPDSDVWNAAYGTAVTQTRTYVTADQWYDTAAMSPTPSGTAAAGCYIVVRLGRDGDDATNDTATGTSRVVYLKMQYKATIPFEETSW